MKIFNPKPVIEGGNFNPRPRWITPPILAVLLCLGLLPLHASPAPAVSIPAPSPYPLITEEEVLVSLAANHAEWENKMGTARPRLFFSGDRLAAMKARLEADPADRDAILQLAQKIVDRPVRAYTTPEYEVANNHVTVGDSHQELWQRDVGDDLQILSFATLLHDTPDYRQKLKDIVLNACSYPTWGQETFLDRDLSCAHLCAGIAMAWDWHHDIWSEQEKKTVIATIKDRASHTYAALFGGIFWSHAYVDNHNQNDMSGLGLVGLAFYDEIPDAPAWLAAARLDMQAVAKYSPEDGGSPEGIPYWSYGRTFILLFIEGTRAVLDSGQLYQQPFLKNGATYRLYSSVAGFSGTLPWGDAPTHDFCGPQHLLDRLASEYRDSSAQWLSQAIPFQPKKNILVWTALWKDPTVPADQPPKMLDFHAWVSDIVTSRSGWGPNDYTFSLKSGFTNRNHCHLDAGALIFAIGGDWLLTAPGYGRGAGTPGFWDSSAGRWDFYSNSTEAENTLLIDGRNQRFDADARGTIDTFFATPAVVWTGVDLTQAYAGVSQVRREVIHHRGSYILVLDHAAADHPIAVDWLVQPALPMRPEGNALVMGDEDGQLRLEMLAPAQPFQPRQPTSPKVDNPPETIHTQTVRQTGNSVRFIALLQPTVAGDTPISLRPEVIEKPGQPLHLILHGPDWTDHIYRSDTAATIAEGGAKITGTSASFRFIGSDIDSCVALHATAVDVAGIGLRLSTPQNIGLQHMPDGWILDADAKVDGQLALPVGLVLIPLSEPAVSGGETYRYFISANGAPRAEADDWLARQIVYRQIPPPKIEPLPDQPPLPAAVSVSVEAEDYLWQRHGTSQKMPKPEASGGYAIKGFGSGSARQAIDWKVNVPQTGRYVINLRYSLLGTTSFSIFVDGAITTPDALHVGVPSTGGWSNDKSDWSDFILTDPQGKPMVFPLTAGPHEIRLANPVSDINLDKITLQGSN